MSNEAKPAEEQLVTWVRAAAAGDKTAAHEVLQAVQDNVYRLALRMLGHPQDAEDAAQEVLVIVLTHLGSFRGESSFSTWVWRIAARRLAEVKRGRRETESFEALEARLHSLQIDVPPAAAEEAAESAVLAHEVRLRCTQAMLLSLDRLSRMAYVLGDIFNLSGEEAAAVLEIEPAAFRQRLVRARQRLYDFMRRQCGLFDPSNPCRCERVASGATARDIVQRDALLFANQPVAISSPVVRRAAGEVRDLMRVAEIIRERAEYTAPEALTSRLRQLLQSQRLELLRS
jgi:RNA polymerase sigma factor (sigma-70 family)